MQTDISIGDWVRFMKEGTLVIGKVEYLKQHITHIAVYTDVGVVSSDCILEKRTA